MLSGWIDIVLISTLALLSLCSATTVEYDSNALIINGERKIIFSGAIHYPRSTPEMWPELINKAKDGGLDAIETYVFWDRHEPVRRQYDFSGNLDIVKFFRVIQEAGLYVILRIGPYVCAEWNYGGFPMWLHNTPGVELRTDNEIYKVPLLIFFVSNNVRIVSQINTCNGYYCDTFKPNNPKSPKMFTENWSGWYKLWGGKTSYRTAEDMAFSVARFVQAGGVFNNYYMYYGGTNFGRTAGGPYITASYDYDSPLDEYGNLNQPKWGHLKQLHASIKLGEKIITNGTVTIKNFQAGVDLTAYTNNATRERFCFLSNINIADAHIDLQQDGNYTIPAWSVSILQNCSKEIFNTAKVNTQTSLMVKKLYENDKPTNLSWVWAPEPMKDTLLGKGRFRTSQLLDQKETTVDASDYLWYMTSFDMNKNTLQWTNVTLRVTSRGHVLHAYVNKKLIVGSQLVIQGEFTFEKPVTLKPGNNVISLLSATVGLANYGSFFDKTPVGIVDGPVQLMANGKPVMDLSSNLWSYKIGLNGEAKRFYDPTSRHNKWSAANGVSTARPMTWYKTTFSSPSGTDPVVVDLQGMGKGHAWANGKSLGRYWPSQIANANGCSGTCDYRGPYNAGKCTRNCGIPTQRWYHVPRSFLNSNGKNTLILFEEVGGDPSGISFQIVTTETICGNAYEGSTLELSCQGGRTISEIQFASYGNPQGTCSSFKKGSFDAMNSVQMVQKECVGKDSCSIIASDETFMVNEPQGISNKRLAVQAHCSNSQEVASKRQNKKV
ncbi:beta-galactosidase, putative [Ricinus communis]|uniref:beta-galactosidase n=1 Tax=Ricinus communis TaxID=3988 RepID=B9RR67_RICCO|nr:beta-galactosidase, putative [Ricinus communis]